MTASTTTEAKTAAKPQTSTGLAGQTVGDTAVCAVNQTQLIYRGYEIADLAANATFEEVAYLILVGEKPNDQQLKAFNDELHSMREVDTGILEIIGKIATSKAGEADVHPMSILRTGVSLLSHVDPECEDNSPEAEMRKSKRLLAKIPTLIGAMQMARDGKEPRRSPIRT
jgi:citrate synthase